MSRCRPFALAPAAVGPSIGIAASLALLAMTVGGTERPADLSLRAPIPPLSLRGRRPWQSRRPQPTAVRPRSDPAAVGPSIEIAASLALLAMTVGGTERPADLSLRGRRPRQSRRSQPTAVRTRSNPAAVGPGVGIAASLALLAMTVGASAATWFLPLSSRAPRRPVIASAHPSPVIARPKAAAISSITTNGRSPSLRPGGRWPKHRDCRVACAPRDDRWGRRRAMTDAVSFKRATPHRAGYSARRGDEKRCHTRDWI